MSEIELPRDLRLQLRAQAHRLNPVVLLGAQGLTGAVLKEIDRALAAHELIKVRVPDDDRDARETMFATIADQLGAARVQSIGKLLVLYRPKPEEPAEPARKRKEKRVSKAEAAKKTAKRSQAQRPASKRTAPAKRPTKRPNRI
jgi:putative YhbY family RNA-binding protein